jgi:hypothetical protein
MVLCFDYTSSDEEFDMEEQEVIAMLLFMHKHDGSIFGREFIPRRRIYADNKLIINYFVEHTMYFKRYFRRQFQVSLDLLNHIAECVKPSVLQVEEELHMTSWT